MSIYFPPEIRFLVPQLKLIGYPCCCYGTEPGYEGDCAEQTCTGDVAPLQVVLTLNGFTNSTYCTEEDCSWFNRSYELDFVQDFGDGVCGYSFPSPPASYEPISLCSGYIYGYRLQASLSKNALTAGFTYYYNYPIFNFHAWYWYQSLGGTKFNCMTIDQLLPSTYIPSGTHCAGSNVSCNLRSGGL